MNFVNSTHQSGKPVGLCNPPVAPYSFRYLSVLNTCSLNHRNNVTALQKMFMPWHLHPPNCPFTSWINHVRPDKVCVMEELQRLTTIFSTHASASPSAQVYPKKELEVHEIHNTAVSADLTYYSVIMWRIVWCKPNGCSVLKLRTTWALQVAYGLTWFLPQVLG